MDRNAELARVAALMEAPPYFIRSRTPPDTRLANALQLNIEGHIETEPGGRLFKVQGKTNDYIVNGGCTCHAFLMKTQPGGWCKHKIAVELYKRFQRDQSPFFAKEPAMASLAPVTPDMVPSTIPHTHSWITRSTDEACLGCGESRPFGAGTQEAPPTAAPAGRALSLPPCQPLRSIEAIVADLSQPLPPACIASFTRNGAKIEFLHWHTVARILDTYAPGWEGRIVHVISQPWAQDVKGTRTEGVRLIVQYRLTLPCAEGRVTREATGQEDAAEQDYGDSSSNAEAMAFKRAAAKFGVGAYLYAKDGTGTALTTHFREIKHALVERTNTVLTEHDMAPSDFWDHSLARYGIERISSLSIATLRQLLTYIHTNAKR